MINNKLVIGNSKGKRKREAEPDLIDIAADIQTAAPETDQEPVQESVQEPLYENIWGNDRRILNMLDEKQLAARRMYVRAIYMQKVECNTILDSIESEPNLLIKPIEFMVVDISMGGIGVVCEYELNIGTILVFKLTLDGIIYEIKCEVAYCFPNDDKFRVGLKIAHKDKQFIKHLKILVARLSLESKYGTETDNESQIS